jgi:hypothetical protein
MIIGFQDPDSVALHLAFAEPMRYRTGHLRSWTLEPEQQMVEESKLRLLRWLLDNRISMHLYVLRAGTISLVPSLGLAFILAVAGVITEETGPAFQGSPLELIVLIVIAGPPLETLLMGPVLRILSFITERTVRLAILSALVWAGLHSLMAPAWGLAVVWPFFVFSCSYLTWRRRTWWRAILVTSCVHAFQNTFPAIVAAVYQ